MTRKTKKILGFVIDLMAALLVCAVFYAVMWTEHIAVREYPHTISYARLK